jgi:hypothetical protein
MEMVLFGNPGGDLVDIGMLKYLHQRSRSALIHLSLSKSVSIHESVLDERVVILLTVRGGLLPHAFIKPPRSIGIYVISHCLKTGEFCA